MQYSSGHKTQIVSELSFLRERYAREDARELQAKRPSNLGRSWLAMENGCLAPASSKDMVEGADRRGAATHRRCGRRCRGTRSATARPPRPSRASARTASCRRRRRRSRRARTRRAPRARARATRRRCPRARRAAGTRRASAAPHAGLEIAHVFRDLRHMRENMAALARTAARRLARLARLRRRERHAGRVARRRLAARGVARPRRRELLLVRGRASSLAPSARVEIAATPEPAYDDDDELAAFARFEAPRAAETLDAEECRRRKRPSRPSRRASCAASRGEIARRPPTKAPLAAAREMERPFGCGERPLLARHAPAHPQVAARRAAGEPARWA